MRTTVRVVVLKKHAIVRPMGDPATTNQNDFEQQAEQESVGLVREFLDFIRTSKKWWLLPIIAVLAGLAIFLVASGTVAAPWLYTLF